MRGSSLSALLLIICTGVIQAFASGATADETAANANVPAATQPAGQTLMMRGLGVVTHFGRGPNWDVDKLLPLLRQMGVSVVRDGPEWAGIEKTQGQYAIPPGSQHMFDALTQSHIQVIFAIFRRNEIYKDPLDADAAARYASFMARTWQSPQVCAYEIWNEPPNFDFPQYAGRNWLPKYCEMVRKVSAAIRQVNPHAVILHNVECHDWLKAVQTYPEDFAQIDGIDLHPYPKGNPPESSPWHAPITDAQHSMLSYMTIAALDYPRKYLGRELQMWVGEYGYPTMKASGGEWMGVTEQMQAAYQVRGMLLGLHAGVKVWCIYDFVNEGTNPTDNEDNMGLVRDISQNHQPKQAFYAVQRVARLMGPDWQIAGDVTARVDIDPASLAVAKDAPGRKVVSGPQLVWFRVGREYIAYVWNAGWYVDEAQPAQGQIVWSNAPQVTAVSAQDLVSGKTVEVTLTQTDKGATLSGVPVGSNPVAIRWVAKP